MENCIKDKKKQDWYEVNETLWKKNQKNSQIRF